MSCRHGTLSGTIGEAIVVESSREQGKLSSIAGEASMEEAEAPHETSVPSGTTSKVSTEKGKVIPPLGDEAMVMGRARGRYGGLPSQLKTRSMNLLSCKEN